MPEAGVPAHESAATTETAATERERALEAAREIYAFYRDHSALTDEGRGALDKDGQERWGEAARTVQKALNLGFSEQEIGAEYWEQKEREAQQQK